MNKLKKLVISAMFAAICCVATMLIKFPTYGTEGYINIGDVIVLLSAWIIGGLYGGIAAGIGSMLADVLAGYTTYAPGTLVIKFLMAIAAFLIFTALKKVNSNKIISYIISGVVAEVIMVFGYFLYESTLLGYGLGAAASIPSNAIQGFTCLVLGTVAVSALEGSKVIYRIKKAA